MTEDEVWIKPTQFADWELWSRLQNPYGEWCVYTNGIRNDAFDINQFDKLRASAFEVMEIPYAWDGTMTAVKSSTKPSWRQCMKRALASIRKLW